MVAERLFDKPVARIHEPDPQDTYADFTIFHAGLAIEATDGRVTVSTRPKLRVLGICYHLQWIESLRNDDRSDG